MPKTEYRTIRLRALFLLTFALCALLPAAFLAVWTIGSQVEHELENTQNKQIALAKTFALALDRYAKDRLSIFQECADAYFHDNISSTGLTIAQKYGFVYFVTISKNNTSKVIRLYVDTEINKRLKFYDPLYGISSAHGVFNSSYTGSDPIMQSFGGAPLGMEEPALPAQVEQAIIAFAGDAARFMPVVVDYRGRPTVFIVQRGEDGRIIAGALDASPIADLQQAIGFGIHGHAVVVDQEGKVLGHPKTEWEASLKSLAGIEPVRLAVSGETGATQFYAPARSEDAIAGYTRTEIAGWGVLMVRPLEEVNVLAWQNASIAMTVIGIGVAIAFLVAWIMTGVIVRPVESAAAAARALSNGVSSARVDPVPKVPAELAALATTLNHLAERIDTWRRTAAETLSTVRAADQAKQDFMATLSHEIRTPLNAIIGFGELVAMGEGKSEQDIRNRDYADSIVMAGRHLLHLIDDILDLAAIEAGHLAVDKSAVNLREVVEEATALLAQSASSHGVSLSVDLSPNLPLVTADPHKLRQIVLNLAGNGIKFTQKGGTVSISASQPDDSTLALSISDTGVGMTADEIQTAFATFGRVRNAKTRGEPGTGLGLPLARRLIETMNGTFSLESKPGQGTTVVIGLPVTQDIAPAQTTSS
jgi:signal transduction histidine kinase